MKLITFTQAGSTRIGIWREDSIVDLSACVANLPTSMLGFLHQGAAAMAIAATHAGAAAHFSHDQVRLEAPVPRPGKILAIGLNYRSHAIESGAEIPVVPLVFTKQATAVTGPFDAVYAPPETKLLDYEGELGVIIGKRCRRVPKEHAKNVIAGFCVVNDVSVRDWQLRGKPPQFTMGKSWDTHCPFGPALVTSDEVDPHTLSLRTLVNGEVRQDSNTNDLIFNCYELIAFLSTAFTLEQGDLIVTGTPSGVGMAMKPMGVLSVGDKVRVEISGLGAIENEIVAEPASVVVY